MKGHAEGTYFEAVIGAGGRIDVPPPVLRRLGAHAGTRVRVHILPAHVAQALDRYDVSAGELERIAAVQRESEEQVIAFLLAEGILSRAQGSRRRAGGRKK
jgi:hypothetical protein